MKCLVIRHGETQYNRDRIMQGYQEVPLNDTGIAQAAQAAERLAREGIAHIVCSDIRRAVMTGCIIAARCGTPMTYDIGLRERNPGELVERPYEEEPRFFNDPDYVPPGGEGVPEFRARVKSTFQRIGEAYEGKYDVLAIVAHGLVCHAFVEEFFGTEFSDGVGAGNATITIARYENGNWTLDSATCSAHLDVNTTTPIPAPRSDALGVGGE